VLCGEDQIRRRYRGERRFNVHADAVAAGPDRLDEGGARPAHRIEDEVTLGGVRTDRVGRQVGQHLRRLTGRLVHIPAGRCSRAGRWQVSQTEVTGINSGIGVRRRNL